MCTKSKVSGGVKSAIEPPVKQHLDAFVTNLTPKVCYNLCTSYGQGYPAHRLLLPLLLFFRNSHDHEKQIHRTMSREIGISRTSVHCIFKRARWKFYNQRLLRAMNEDDPDQTLARGCRFCGQDCLFRLRFI
jgi:hypothetical protein